jgi:nitrite reductase (NO-forming)
MHNFNLDEFNISAETPKDEVTTIEFIADKTGSFQYYCSKPGHRAAGHWGTLIVDEPSDK